MCRGELCSPASCIFCLLCFCAACGRSQIAPTFCTAKQLGVSCSFPPHQSPYGDSFPYVPSQFGIVVQPAKAVRTLCLIGTPGCCFRHWRRSLKFLAGACRNVRRIVPDYGNLSRGIGSRSVRGFVVLVGGGCWLGGVCGVRAIADRPYRGAQESSLIRVAARPYSRRDPCSEIAWLGISERDS